MNSQERAFHEFAQFAAKLNGDEKSDAQTFLLHLFEAFSHDANTLPEGCTFDLVTQGLILPMGVLLGKRTNPGRRHLHDPCTASTEKKSKNYKYRRLININAPPPMLFIGVGMLPESDVTAAQSCTATLSLQFPQLFRDLREAGVDLVERDPAVQDDHREQNERSKSQNTDGQCHHHRSR